MKIQFKPWVTPNFVLLVNRSDVSFSLKELEAEDLDKLCEQFREEVFKKAEKIDPRKIRDKK